MSTNQSTICPPAEAGGLERTRFFPRQLITPDDLTQDQVYFREKMRRHNRLLHGWGVVCGVRVRQGAGDCEVIVEEGYVLGPYGDEILVDREVTIDLCREGLDGNAVSPCGEGLDPWCSDVRVNRRAGQTLYLAVRYAECESRPVRAHANGCGCDESECEYSRIRDSFAIKVLTSLPATYADPMPQPDIDGVVRCAHANDQFIARPCPECPSEPWVILADITLGPDGSIGKIDCFAHRRYVASFADYYYLCQPRKARPIGHKELVDLTAERAGMVKAARMLVAARRQDGSEVYIPAYYDVKAGETYAEFLAREGDREYYDPELDEKYTLKELYALADVDPQAKIHGVAEAVAPLEGLEMRVNALRQARKGLEATLDESGIERLEKAHAGSPAAADHLPATAIRGVSPRSHLGHKVRSMTIGEIASMDREAFTALALEGVSPRRAKAVERQAHEVWEAAAAVKGVSRIWKK